MFFLEPGPLKARNGYTAKDCCMATNFDLAPPAKTVDGLQAVPIDIQKITASLAFDGATSSGQGDATLEFIMGPQNGNPIFDLRQTITAAWLDGVPLPLAQLAEHDFGGGPSAQLRIVESVLIARTSHTLRLTYGLGPAQAPPAGSYQPAISLEAVILANGLSTGTWSHSGRRAVLNRAKTMIGGLKNCC